MLLGWGRGMEAPLTTWGIHPNLCLGVSTLGTHPSASSGKSKFHTYGKVFNSLEHDATFYRFHSEKTWTTWHEYSQAISPAFTVSPKVMKFFTHTKRLVVDDSFRRAWGVWWGNCSRLQNHLGAVLFQFHHSFKLTETTLGRMRALAEVLPQGQRFAFEFRHPTFYEQGSPLVQQLHELMRAHSWCEAWIDLCNTSPGRPEHAGWAGDMTDGTHPAGFVETADFTFIRFHGPLGMYVGTYGAVFLLPWVQRIREQLDRGRQVYVYFNNTDSGAGGVIGAPCRSALHDAGILSALLRLSGLGGVEASGDTGPETALQEQEASAVA